MNWLRNFMMGRYGTDQLSLALIVFSLVLSLLLQLTGVYWLTLLAYIPLFLAVFRTFSRNTAKRYGENARFLRLTAPLASWFRKQAARLREGKTHRFYKCPGCGQTLRVPKGRGKIVITCPKCRREFTKKT